MRKILILALLALVILAMADVSNVILTFWLCVPQFKGISNYIKF